MVTSQYNNLNLKRYPLITNPILSYPMLSFPILSYPRGRTPRCASNRLPESVPAAYSKSIKAFLQIITVSVFHPFPLQEQPPAGPAASGPADRQAARQRRPRRPRRLPPQHGCVGLRRSSRDPAAEPKERRKDATCASGPDDFNRAR